MLAAHSPSSAHPKCSTVTTPQENVPKLFLHVCVPGHVLELVRMVPSLSPKMHAPHPTSSHAGKHARPEHSSVGLSGCPNTDFGVGHAAHLPPQPSDWPHTLPVQFGAHGVGSVTLPSHFRVVGLQATSAYVLSDRSGAHAVLPPGCTSRR